MPAHPYPWAVERAYMADVEARVRAVHAVLADAAHYVLKGYAPATQLTDAMVAAAVRSMDRAAVGIRNVPPDLSMLAGHAIAIEEWSVRVLRKELPKVRPMPTLFASERAWVTTNTVLLKRLDGLLIQWMKNAIVETLGGTVGDLADVLLVEERMDSTRPNGRISMTGPTPRLLKTPLDVALARGRTVAQDQVGKGAAQMSKQTQQAAGVTSYRWITMRDDRVRPEHRRREGRIFRWAAPPPDGHPGEPINCRCHAKPVVVVERSQRGGAGRFRL